MYQKKHKQFPNIKVHDALNLGVAPSYMNISGSGVVDYDDRTATSQTPAESLAALTGTDMSEDASSNNSGAGSAAGAGITGAGGSGVA
jgi:hypothetical protein